MKKLSFIHATSVFVGVFFLTALMFQCRKTGDIIKNLDRSFGGNPDSTVYASFYSNYTISTADIVPDVNDVINARGVQTILHEYCATSNCHGGRVNPKFDTYAEVMKFVTPGSPQSSKLWEMITTNDFDKAMPPVNSNHELTITDKGIVFNWITNGAKEYPDLNDFRPAAIRLITAGCASVSCHSRATAAGGWARKGILGTLTTSDTVGFTNPLTGAITCQLVNKTKLDEIWGTDDNPPVSPYSYKDSVKKFYTDTLGNASFRPWKTLSSPTSSGTRGPLESYDDVLMDVLYPKSIRSSTSVVYTDPVTLKQYYVRGNPLLATDCLIRRVDSSLIYRNPLTLTETSKNGSMAYDDGGMKPSEIALLKAWYFADPNIPEVWKYGNNNVGIFKYRNTGNFIIRR
ncbi:MAG: c-type cytochrome domain-containing protein [Chitinophagaceae bacterium]